MVVTKAEFMKCMREVGYPHDQKAVWTVLDRGHDLRKFRCVCVRLSPKVGSIFQRNAVWRKSQKCSQDTTQLLKYH